jgi:FdhD protein
VLRVQNGAASGEADFVATEEPLEIRVFFSREGKPEMRSVAITMRTPGDGHSRLATDFELAAGFLFTEGMVASRSEIERIAYCNDEPDQHYNVVNVYLSPSVEFDPAILERNFYINSSCGVCGKASIEALRFGGCPVLPLQDRVSPEVLYGLPEALRLAQETFQRTGGLHGAALFDFMGTPLVVREDVGRHNAVDKVIGERFLTGRAPVGDSILLVSGRTSYEIVQKALMAAVPIVAAVGAPSSLAVRLAEEFGMTLVGFLRGRSFNVYAGRERIAF